MQRTSKFAVVLLVLAFALAAGRLALKTNQPQPAYLGKPVSYWLTDGFSFSSSVDGRLPESAFRRMGSNAVPFLMATLARTDGPLKQIYFSCYTKLPVRVQKQLPHLVPADVARRRAIFALAIIGPAAKPAIPALLKVLANDPDGLRRGNAVTCLDAIDGGQLQNEVVDAWLRARSDPDPVVARTATDVLRWRFPLGVLQLDAQGTTLVREDADVHGMVHTK